MGSAYKYHLQLIKMRIKIFFLILNTHFPLGHYTCNSYFHTSKRLKMKTLFFLIGVTSLLCVCAVPVDKPLTPTPPKSEISAFKNVTAPYCTTQDNVRRVKNGMIDTRYRWSNFYVHPDMAYNDQERQAINDAMYNLMQILPCVTFGIWPPESNPGGDFVRIIKGTNNGCNSYVGRLGGRQDMNLQSPGCMSIGTIMHEMIHALGFHHEHGRPDRDDHVDILWQNVIPGMEYAFDKYPPSEVTTFNVPYNYRSIMHYDSGAFSSNGQPTMVSKTGEPIGSIDQLQDTDIQKLKIMYNC